MTDRRLPVTVAVTRPDGSQDQVRVGWATPTVGGFSLQLGDLTIGTTAAADAPSQRGRSAPGTSAPPGSSGAVFPPYGRSKGAPVAGASVQDLEYYASGARRSLADPSKARWHDKERQLLLAIEAELARQGSGGPPPRDDDDAPPNFDDSF